MYCNLALLRTCIIKPRPIWNAFSVDVCFPDQTWLRTVRHTHHSTKSSHFIQSLSREFISPKESRWNHRNLHKSLKKSLHFTHFPILQHDRFFSTSLSSTIKKFEDMENLDPKSKRALDQMGLVHLTEIQAKSFDIILSGDDVLARARTGTGKTLAFLLPALERILKNRSMSASQDTGLEILILSPTRELALQIYEQARALLSYHDNGRYGNKLAAQVVFGGTSKQQDFKSFNKQLPCILVATPGRLKDHLESTQIPSSASYSSPQSLSDRMRSNLQILIIDEMDRLLDMGFIDDIKNILTYLPPKTKRQTLLFSATLPAQLKSVLETTLKPGYVTVDCIQDLDPATHTNTQVDQSHVIVPSKTKWISSTVETILYITLQAKLSQGDNASTPYKIVAFFPTTSLVSYYADLFNFGFGIKVMELHSRKSQNYRTSVSNRFREVSQGILFTSDVSARGVDYPNVTHVIQFGIADGRETYIHRLGRTGRAGKRGRGLLVVTDVEGPGFLQSCVSDLDVAKNKDNDLEACILMDSDNNVGHKHDDVHDGTTIATAVKREAKQLLDPVLQAIQSGKNDKLQKAAEDAYRSLLGFYIAQLPSIGIKSKKIVVDKANAFAQQAGLTKPPTISFKLAKTLGIDKLDGIHIMDEYSREEDCHKDNFTRVKENRFQSADSRYRGDRPSSSSVKSKNRQYLASSYEEWGTRIPIVKVPK